MRILAVSHACVVDVNQQVYRELSVMGHEVAIVVPDRWRNAYSPGGFRPERLADFSGPLIPMPVWNPGSVPLHAYVGRLARILEKIAPDVIYIEEEPYSTAAFQWAWAAGRSGAATAFFTAQNIVKKYPLPFRISEQFVWWRSGAGICATANIATTLQARGYRGKTWVIPYAVDVNCFRPRASDGELRARLGLRPRVVAYLGRLVEEKGVKVLLEAYRRLPRWSATTLLCLGGGPLADECREEPGVVVVEGLRHSGVPEYLALADLVVLPSLTTRTWKEQFGRAAIEAMACGLPMIGSDSGEIPNVVGGTGGGLIVPEGNAPALTNAIASLLDDPEARRDLGERGRSQVQQHYSTRAVAERLAAALGLMRQV